MDNHFENAFFKINFLLSYYNWVVKQEIHKLN